MFVVLSDFSHYTFNNICHLTMRVYTANGIGVNWICGTIKYKSWKIRENNMNTSNLRSNDSQRYYLTWILCLLCWLMSILMDIRLKYKRSRKYWIFWFVTGSWPNTSLYSITPWAIVGTTSLCLFRMLTRASTNLCAESRVLKYAMNKEEHVWGIFYAIFLSATSFSWR